MRIKIASVGEPVLRGEARPLTPEEIRSQRIHDLIENMRETLSDAPGVGLAAPQVGEPLQITIIEDKAEYHGNLSGADLEERERRPIPFHVLINPRIHFVSPWKLLSLKVVLACPVSPGLCRALAACGSRLWIILVSRCASRPRAGMRAFCSTRSTICAERCTSTECGVAAFLRLRITTGIGN